MTRTWTTIIALVIYIVIIGLLTIYYGFNFFKFVHYKGDEFFYYAFFLLTASAIFQVIISQTTKVMTLKFGLITTLINFGLSFIIGFTFWTVTGISGIPRNLIFIYGGCYLTILTLLTVLKAVTYEK